MQKTLVMQFTLSDCLRQQSLDFRVFPVNLVVTIRGCRQMNVRKYYIVVYAIVYISLGHF